MPLAIGRRHFLASAGACAAGAAIGWPLVSPAGAAILRPDRELMVPVEGGRIYVRTNGPLHGPKLPILFIHGGPGGTHAGFLNALPLTSERGVILYDQLDSGRSDTPNDPRNWRVERFVDEVDAIRKALALERFHILGGSWGGTIALEYAARRPAALAATVLQSPLISTKSWLTDAGVLRGELPADTQKVLAECDAPTPPPAATCDAATNQFYARFLRRMKSSAELTAYGRGLPVPFNSKIYEAMWGHTEFVSTGSLRNYDGEPLLARLDGKRTLFVCGEYDEARPATLAAFSRRVPGSSFAVIEDSGHGVFNDNPVAVQDLLRRWLPARDVAA
jgi:proline iminopeptidase/L-proline amide hydrolase